MHRILERYSEIAREILERHEGEIEKFIGDAVVAVFGLTELHEDDALRAVRAAVELRDAVMDFRDEFVETSGIEFGISIGVNSGDVFVGGGEGRETFATGDSVNVAARLEQRAEAWEILLGRPHIPTGRGRRPRRTAGAIRSQGSRGAGTGLEAARAGRATNPVVAHPTPFVGREREQDELREAFALSREQRTCRLCTIVGPAGIGKTRIAREMVAEASQDGHDGIGRCLSYGEAITYHPLIEIVRQLVGDDPDQGITKLMGAGEDSELVARRMRGLVGSPTRPRQLRRRSGRCGSFSRLPHAERPLIVGFEDVHWAEPLLLDLIEYLVGFSHRKGDSFVLCLARPELLETRPSWAVERRDQIGSDLGGAARGRRTKARQSLTSRRGGAS